MRIAAVSNGKHKSPQSLSERRTENITALGELIHAILVPASLLNPPDIDDLMSVSYHPRWSWSIDVRLSEPRSFGFRRRSATRGAGPFQFALRTEAGEVPGSRKQPARRVRLPRFEPINLDTCDSGSPVECNGGYALGSYPTPALGHTGNKAFGEGGQSHEIPQGPSQPWH